MLNKGDRPYMKEQAYQQALAFNPNIVVIKLGTNDSKSFNWVHKADFIKDTQTMIDAFKALPSQPEIYLCYPSKAYLTGESINDDIISKEIIPMIKKVAKKNKLPVIDLHSAMDGMPELFPDHIHPNEEGAKVMAKAVYDAIANKRKRRSRQELISQKETFYRLSALFIRHFVVLFKTINYFCSQTLSKQ